MNENESNESAVKAWFEDNLRVLLSILIVVAIAGGIYSYSKRSQAPTVTDAEQEMQSAALESLTADQTDSTLADTGKNTEKDSVTSQDKQVTSDTTETSKETESSFVESAQRGDGMTHLARRAVANYLEKNPDSALTAEHKIYIEDYLRKNVRSSSKVAIGSSVDFSKDLIHSAIENSKKLDDRQLKNLHRYSVRAPSLK